MERLAIVIPYYKNEFFEDCLDSLAAQVDKRFTLYVGNDGSPEDPFDIIERFKGQMNLNYFAFNDNLGKKSLVGHWNRCLQKVMEEEWVMILGDDDRLSANCVAMFYSQLDEVKRLGINVIRFASCVINAKGHTISGPFSHPEIEGSTDFLLRRFTGKSRSSLSEYIFKKQKVIGTGFQNLPLAWYADLLGVLEFSDFGSIYTINSSIVYFRISGKNISSRNDNLKEKNVASFHFFYYLLNKKSENFNPNQLNFLKGKLEKTFLDNKKNRKFWIMFSQLYFSQHDLKRYLLFLTRMGKKIITK